MYCEKEKFSQLPPLSLSDARVSQLENEFLEIFYEMNWDTYPEPEVALYFLAEKYFKKAEYDKGVDALERLVHLEPENPIHYYRLTCLYACLKNKKKSLQYLETAIQLGFEDKQTLLSDEALRCLWEEEEFQILIRKMDPPPP
jgi:tetratricopeptide (TPR) repeat protein